MCAVSHRDPQGLGLSLEDFRGFLENAGAAALMIASDWRIRYFNASGIPSGTSAAEAVGKIFWDVFPAARGTAFEHQYVRAMRERVAVHFEEYYEPLNLWLQVSAFPISEGGIAVYARDISEARLAMDRVAVIAENASLALFLMDNRQHCVFMNPAAEAMTGFTFAEVHALNKPLHDIIHHTRPDGRHYPMSECPIDRALPEKSRTRGEDVFVRKNGALYPVAFTASPILRDGKPVSTVIEVRDTTHDKEVEARIRGLNAELEEKVRRRTADLVAANTELETFSYSVSHDLRAPLRGITGFTSLALKAIETGRPAEASASLQRVLEGATRMAQLTSALLELSRLTKKPLSPALVDLGAEAEAILSELARAEPSRRVRTVVGRGMTVLADRELLRVLLRNLLDNAWKFTSKESEALIEVGREGDVFFVRDNGAGFDPAYAERLFRPFQRLHSGSEFPGTGVGLATVERVVKRHGGRVWAESGPGQGATFRFSLTPPVQTP